MSRSISVYVVTRLCTGRCLVRNPGGTRDFLLSKTATPALKPPCLPFNRCRVCSQEVKGPRLRMGGAIPLIPICLHCGKMDGPALIFFIYIHITKCSSPPDTPALLATVTRLKVCIVGVPVLCEQFTRACAKQRTLIDLF